jgi:hypothetical protein
VGKSERAISVSGYVNKGWVKIARDAYEKVTVYKGRRRNHLLSRITGFRIGVQDRDDDLLDAWVYAIALAPGNAHGFQAVGAAWPSDSMSELDESRHGGCQGRDPGRTRISDLHSEGHRKTTRNQR